MLSCTGGNYLIQKHFVMRYLNVHLTGELIGKGLELITGFSLSGAEGYDAREVLKIFGVLFQVEAEFSGVECISGKLFKEWMGVYCIPYRSSLAPQRGAVRSLRYQ